MSGPGDPPEGAPEGAPGGDDEYRSVVFDESFVRAARIQEYSASERLDGTARSVRVRHVLPRSLARQAVALLMLLVLAFGFAIYMGVRHPYRAPAGDSNPQLRVTLIPLVPTGTVAAVPVSAPFAGSAAATYRSGPGAINAPAAERVGDFAESEVYQAYQTAVEYLTASAIDPRAVTGGDVGTVRNLLDPAQLDQFEASVTHPSADGSQEATGWLVRFDPAEHLQLVGGAGGVRVKGQLFPPQTSNDMLEISTDHTFVYALRGPGSPDMPISLFTVRRQLQFRFTHRDLEQDHLQVTAAEVAAGPLSCGNGVESYFRPILAGGQATGRINGVNPFDQNPVTAVCAPLGSDGAPPSGTPTTSGPAVTASAGPTVTASAGPTDGTAAGTPGATPGRAQATGLTPPPRTPQASHPAL
ncbi:MAG: hypothetical protein FWE15_00775 [Actinomycetia bacterium]|nr:hypothetical protein [Actinomycetes bacterium]MCL2728536.1 hypothetical protein [Actinomycetes bacterium]